jgi:hypothetical protein
MTAGLAQPAGAGRGRGCRCKPSLFRFEFPMGHAFRPLTVPVDVD